MRSQQQLLAPGLGFLIREEQRVLRIARRVIRRKIQRFEIVVVGFDHRPFGNGITQALKYANDFILCADDWVLSANGATNAGERDVDRGFGGRVRCLRERGFHLLLDFCFQLIDSLTDIALGFFWCGLQPEFVDLREYAVFAREPTITERLLFGFALHRSGFLLQSGKQLFDGFVERGGREIFQFRNGVGHFHAPAASAATSN